MQVSLNPVNTLLKSSSRRIVVDENQNKVLFAFKACHLTKKLTFSEFLKTRPMYQSCLSPAVMDIKTEQPCMEGIRDVVFYTTNCSNTFVPFYTSGKATCGYLFMGSTDHRRKKWDTPTANIMKWRCHSYI
ncbi:ciliary microtubule inner protein 3 isoform X2 [Ascaphus truei]|uniref:ciliary microtubule inner protein 3 isoform X2 n=1 Tax=Ascaphus truei TaxID=8439 RepID=UPI003F5AB238